ncbi:hypothetical protein NQZ68_017745, partial [Dissostichus eleginoides]
MGQEHLKITHNAPACHSSAPCCSIVQSLHPSRHSYTDNPANEGPRSQGGGRPETRTLRRLLA